MKSLVLAVVVVGVTAILPACKKCRRGHYEQVKHEAWTQYIWTGKFMMPIFHPEYTSNDFICDEYETDDKSSVDCK